MRGVKLIEYRTLPTKVRGRVRIYASLGRYSAAEEAKMMDYYGIDDVACDDLSRGVIVGTVELWSCKKSRRYPDYFEWHVRNPKRAKNRRRPKNKPQPVWFNPF